MQRLPEAFPPPVAFEPQCKGADMRAPWRFSSQHWEDTKRLPRAAV